LALLPSYLLYRRIKARVVAANVFRQLYQVARRAQNHFVMSFPGAELLFGAKLQAPKHKEFSAPGVSMPQLHVVMRHFSQQAGVDRPPDHPIGRLPHVVDFLRLTIHNAVNNGDL
jgi:hypothetical protein